MIKHLSLSCYCLDFKCFLEWASDIKSNLLLAKSLTVLMETVKPILQPKDKRLKTARYQYYCIIPFNKNL